jgi:hypothetical protein
VIARQLADLLQIAPAEPETKVRLQIRPLSWAAQDSNL